MSITSHTPDGGDRLGQDVHVLLAPLTGKYEYDTN